ncbi:MAG: exodeoxyribonuclease III [Acidobacteria bacterium]|nr:exodeoxyribonuclease III [Acidobacteriota bacterium]
MKIATWNINSISTRLDHVLRWTTKNHPDVLCLQETKVPDKKFPVARLRSVGYEYMAYSGEGAYNGVAILSKYPIEDVQKNFPRVKDPQQRLIAGTVQGVKVVNVYVPHGTRIGMPKFEYKLDWIKRLRKFLDKRYSVDELVLLCGDFNITPHELDLWNIPIWVNKLHFTKPERDVIQHLKKWGFIDLFRLINEDVQEYSWWDYFHHSFDWNKGLRLDHIWTSPPLADLCRDCWIDKDPRGWDHPTDHAPVVAELSV